MTRRFRRHRQTLCTLGVDIHGRAAPGDSGLFSHVYRCTRCSESWSEVEFITPAEAEERAKAHRCEPKDVVC